MQGGFSTISRYATPPRQTPLTIVTSGSTTNTTPDIIGTAAEDGITVTLIIRDSGGSVVQTGTPTVIDGVWTYPVSPALDIGTYSLQATATVNGLPEQATSSLTIAVVASGIYDSAYEAAYQ